MHRSTTERIAPAGLDVFPVFADAGYCWVAARERKHLCAILPTSLGIAVDERNSLRVVVVARLLAIWTAGFRVDNQGQARSPPSENLVYQLADNDEKRGMF